MMQPSPTRRPKPRAPHEQSSGFTLLEMAIVIVIIGLLVGGLAGMRAYSRNASISAMMNDARFYITAFNQFQNRYGSPPGDLLGAAAMWSAAGDGDGNGLIRATSTAGNGNRDELFYTFEHLALGGFIPGSYTGATAGGTANAKLEGSTKNVPGTSIDKVALLFDNPDFSTATSGDGFISGQTDYFDGQYPNTLIITGLIDTATAIDTIAGRSGFLTPKQMLQLDEKHDDGRPATGMMVVREPASTGATDQECANSTDAAAAVYKTTVDGKNCYPIIKIQ